MIRTILRATAEHVSNFVSGDRDRAVEEAEADARANANDDMGDLEVTPRRTEAQQLEDRARAIVFRGAPAEVLTALEGGAIRLDLMKATLENTAWQYTFVLLYAGVTTDPEEAGRLAMKITRDMYGIQELIDGGAQVVEG